LKKAFAAEPRNGETAFAIGEAFRRQAQEGGDSYRNMEGVDYRQLAEQAIEWFIRSEKLNAWNCYSFLSQGWCLDWLDRKAESAPCFDRAEQNRGLNARSDCSPQRIQSLKTICKLPSAD
jgi:hypothetical protein